jgi:hypothetical protein
VEVGPGHQAAQAPLTVGQGVGRQQVAAEGQQHRQVLGLELRRGHLLHRAHGPVAGLVGERHRRPRAGERRLVLLDHEVEHVELDPVSRLHEVGLARARPVDQDAVAAAEVAHRPAVALGHELDVLARHPVGVEHHVALGRAPEDHPRPGQAHVRHELRALLDLQPVGGHRPSDAPAPRA